MWRKMHGLSIRALAKMVGVDEHLIVKREIQFLVAGST